MTDKIWNPGQTIFPDGVEIYFEVDKKVVNQDYSPESKRLVDSGLGPMDYLAVPFYGNKDITLTTVLNGLGITDTQDAIKNDSQLYVFPTLETTDLEDIGIVHVLDDGTAVVDVRLDVEDLIGVNKYEIRVSPIE